MLGEAKAILTLEIPFESLEEFGKFTQLIMSSNEFTITAEHGDEVMECTVTVAAEDIGTRFL